MAYPVRPTSDLFSNDQRIDFEALYFDTTSTAVRVGESYDVGERDTALGKGVNFALFDLLDSGFNPASKAALDAALVSGSTSTKAVLGYEVGGAARTGVVPNIYMYWGSGAPPGATRSRQVLMKFSGVVPQTISNVTLVAAGQGTVRIYRNGSSTALISGTISEPLARTQRLGITIPRLKTELGYQFNETPVTLNAGDTLEIYYWHNGEPWGGFGLKMIMGSIAANTFLDQLRDAAVVGGSVLSQSTTPLSGTPIPYLLSYDLSLGREKIPSLRLVVPITSTAEPTGYRVSRVDGMKVLRDNANLTFDIKKGSSKTLKQPLQKLPSSAKDC
jgi:hypothetical protein